MVNWINQNTLQDLYNNRMFKGTSPFFIQKRDKKYSTIFFNFKFLINGFHFWMICIIITFFL